MRRYLGISSSALFIVLLTGATPATALTIIDTFSGSLASNPTMRAAIQAASSTIASLYSNPVTVTINFQLSNIGLGWSSQYLYGVSYTAYTQALNNDHLANLGNTTLATAMANMSRGNDASGATPIALTSSLVDALGLGYVSAGGSIGLNSSLLYFGSGPVPSGLYSATAVIEHEIDEILGGGGGGSMLGSSLQGLYYGTLDLYRYSASGTPSYTSSSTTPAYFSVNGGANLLVQFSQTGKGDYGDFYNTCFIQNWAGCPGHTPEAFAGSIEDTMLQSLGYDHFASGTSPSLSITGKTGSLRSSISFDVSYDPAPTPRPGVGLASFGLLTVAGAAARLLEIRRMRREAR